LSHTLENYVLDKIEHEQRAIEFAERLAMLPDWQRFIFIITLYGYTPAEIARRTDDGSGNGITRSEVSRVLCRAKKKLGIKKNITPFVRAMAQQRKRYGVTSK